MAVLVQKLDIFLIESSSPRWANERDGIRNAPSQPSGGFAVINDPKESHCQSSSACFYTVMLQQEARLQLESLGGFSWILLFNQRHKCYHLDAL